MISSQHNLSSLHAWPAFARLFVIKIIKLTGFENRNTTNEANKAVHTLVGLKSSN